MEMLRRARHLTRLVLAWFALSVGIAIAAPAVQPAAGDAICSAASAMPSGGSDQQGAPQLHAHDCVLCGMTGAPAAVRVAHAQALPLHEPTAVLPVPCAGEAVTPFCSRAPPAI